MHEFLATTLRLLSGSTGILLFYTALFTYTDEQNRIQDRLVDIWVRIGEMRTRAIGKHTAFMRVVAGLTGKFFDALFGNKLFSLQAFVVSTYFAFASFELGYLYETRHSFFGDKLFLLLCIALNLTLGTAFAMRSRIKLNFFRQLLTTLILGCLCVMLLSGHGVVRSMVGCGLILSYLSDVIFIALTRKIMRRCKTYESFSAIFLLIVASILSGAGLVILPYQLGRSHNVHLLRKIGITEDAASSLIDGMWFSSMCNVLDAFVASVFVFLALLLLLHKLIWPFAERIVNSIYENQVLRNKKLLISIATPLIIFAIPHSTQLFEMLKRLNSE